MGFRGRARWVCGAMVLIVASFLSFRSAAQTATDQQATQAQAASEKPPEIKWKSDLPEGWEGAPTLGPGEIAIEQLKPGQKIAPRKKKEGDEISPADGGVAPPPPAPAKERAPSAAPPVKRIVPKKVVPPPSPPPAAEKPTLPPKPPPPPKDPEIQVPKNVPVMTLPPSALPQTQTPEVPTPSPPKETETQSEAPAVPAIPAAPPTPSPTSAPAASATSAPLELKPVTPP